MSKCQCGECQSDRHEQDAPTYEELEQQLTAEREAREKAEVELAELRKMREESEKQLRIWKQRAESAEQRNREAMEQEPVYQYWMDADHGGWIECTKEHYNSLRECDRQIMYRAIIPPADVAELQRENAKLKRHVETLQAHQTNCACAYEEAEHICEYHRKMTEEAKRQAVPEGWKLVPIEPTREMEDAGGQSISGSRNSKNGSFSTAIFCYSAMLAAAPQPEGVDK